MLVSDLPHLGPDLTTAQIRERMKWMRKNSEIVREQAQKDEALRKYIPS